MSEALAVLSEALDLARARRPHWIRQPRRGKFSDMSSTRGAERALFLISSAARPPGARSAEASDRQVDAAIRLMRENPAAPWTVSQLARKVGVSRPAFARKFVQSTGLSPLRFLTRLRMERAAELLRTSDAKLADVAEQVGYTSEFAFNRAFKRHYRVAPGSYRRQLAWANRPAFRMAA
jgi:transcriptional regulator GlxA family with amidase domain